MQALYEKKWLTYPRTDTPYITENEMAYLKEYKSQYQKIYDIKEALKHTESRSRYVNSKKVQEHHAIIPTRKIPTSQELKSLSNLEQQVYERVLRTTLAMFANPYQYEETKVDLQCQQLEFVAKGKVEIDKGWRRLLSEVKEEKREPDHTLPPLEEDSKLQADLKQIQKETTPPKPYTEGTLVQAMKNAGKKIEDEKTKEILKEVEGIGTEATRADILERLKKQAYMEIVKNQIVITNKGKQLGQVLEEDKLLNSPEMTAAWEKDLKSISTGSLNQETFIKRIKHLIKQYLKQVPERMNQSREALEKLQQQNEQVSTIGTCPLCGKAVKDKGKFYGCEGYREDPSCTFSMSKVIAGKKLSETQIKSLLSKGTTPVLKGFKSKAGKSFEAQLKLIGGKINFDFSGVNKK
ncbi:topoisomerase IA [Listeria aquatica FSL S10-1188]|uniref:Topoisomerase IA n=1 Tax=Listeria aquatica FSL S10-1188 TaxID=1265818 RepID=W7B1H7_9LIST|nr:topoisomerase IA [Listeria aquatica FSL S10-1188]